MLVELPDTWECHAPVRVVWDYKGKSSLTASKNKPVLKRSQGASIWFGSPNTAWDIHIPPWSAYFQSRLLCLWFSFLLMCALGGGRWWFNCMLLSMPGRISIWVPGSSCLWPGLVLAIVNIWGWASRWKISLFPFLCLSNKIKIRGSGCHWDSDCKEAGWTAGSY